MFYSCSKVQCIYYLYIYIFIYLYPSEAILQRLQQGYKCDTRTLCMYIPLMFDISTAVGYLSATINCAY